MKLISKMMIKDILNIDIDHVNQYEFEAAWRLIFSCNKYIEKFQDYEYVEFNPSLKSSIRRKVLFEDVINENINQGSKYGPVDIMLYNKNNKSYVCFSCKFFENDNERFIGDYDIDKMFCEMNEYNVEYGLLVKDKNIVNKKLKNCRSYKKKDLIKHLYGYSDLKYYMAKFKNDYTIHPEYFNSDKPLLIPRFHQIYTVEKTIELFETENCVLWGHKPRSGKTYMLGMLIEKCKFNRVLLITPQPTETFHQYIDELFNKYANFNEYSINKLDETVQDDEYIGNIDKIIIITSKQYLDRHKCLKNITFDLVVFDENDFIGTTRNSKSYIEKHKNRNTKTLFMTATYNKTVFKYSINNKQIIHWDMEDSEIMKNRDLDKLIVKHGEYMRNFIDNNKHVCLDNYDNEPKLFLMSAKYDEEILNNIREKHNNTVYGFSMRSLFDNNGKKLFTHDADVRLFLNYIFGSNRQTVFPNGNNSIINRIRKITGKSFHYFNFYVQYGCKQRLSNTSNILKQYIENDRIGRKYEVIIINTDENHGDNIKEYIMYHYNKAKENPEKLGLIAICGGMLRRAISLPYLDGVFLLDDSKCYDKIIQTIFRPLTELEDKKYGFVVDFKPERSLACILNSIESKGTSNKQQIKVIRNLIEIDTDFFDDTQENQENYLLDIINKANDWVLSSVKYTNLFDIVKSDNYDERFNRLKLLFDNREKANLKVILKDSENELGEICSGEIMEKKANKKKENNEIIQGKLLKVINKLIALSLCITYDENALTDVDDILAIIDYINKHEDLREMYCDMIDNYEVVYNKDKTIKTEQGIKGEEALVLFMELLNEYKINESIDVKNFLRACKYKLNDVIEKGDFIAVFMEIFGDPSKREVKKFGEVYTPIELIQHMIDKMPEDIWKEPSYKFLDFAAGIGSFGYYIYKKLMDGLKCCIVDEGERRRHILENMLYFNDIRKRNIATIKKVFRGNVYNLNIYEGDFLEWNCDMKFDVIIGNPPFQAHSHKRSNGNALWHKFVDKLLVLLEDEGYLSLIHPPGWRKPATSRCKYTHLYKELTQKRQMMYLEMYTERDGLKNFKCDIVYDMYLIKNVPPVDKTRITDHDKKIIKVNLKRLNFIPNKSLRLVHKLLKCKGNQINIIYNRTMYGSDKAHVGKECNDTYKYPLIHSVRKNDIIFRYSSRLLGHFGESKIIIAPRSRNICNSYIDIKGDYGITNNVFAIPVSDIDDANKIQNVLKSKKFRIFKEAMTFHNNIFEFKSLIYFNDGIWDEFLKDD